MYELQAKFIATKPAIYNSNENPVCVDVNSVIDNEEEVTTEEIEAVTV